MNQYVDKYINEFNDGKIKVSKEMADLFVYVKRELEPRLANHEIEFNEKQINDAVAYIEKYFFKLQDFQKFIIALVFLYWIEDGRNVYPKILIMMGRGGGKNGLISGLLSFMLTPFHGIKNYNVSIVANSEDQAKTSFTEIYNTIEENDVLKTIFDNKKAGIKSLQTGSEMKFRTSNGNTKDGLRDGAVVFDEIHQYESNKDVQVHISGLGKVKNPREFYIGTDGYVREGFIDGMKEKAHRVLAGDDRFNAILPIIYKLDDESELDDSSTWQKANPMFHEPMSEYGSLLFSKVKEQYEDLQEDPSNREEFLTKRMNLPVTSLETSVASTEELLATKREMPYLLDHQAIGAVDLSQVRDFTAVGLLFKIEEDYVWLTHSYVTKSFVDKTYGYSRPKTAINGKKQFAPIKKWEEQGLLTVVDTPTINPRLVVEWFVKMRDEFGYNLRQIVMDNFRLDIIEPMFIENGFEVSRNGKFEKPAGYRVEALRNPTAIDSFTAPKIETAFANHHVVFGDNDMMRWYTNNVKRRLKPDGNVIYEKKESVRRKTDGFKAFEYAMYQSNQLETVDESSALDVLSDFW